MSYSLKETVQFDPSNMSAFGTLEVNELDPIVQLDFVYGINSQTGLATTANSATIDTNGSRLRLQSGTNTAGSAIFNSRRIIRYRPGQGVTARFTAVFATGTASNTQTAGVGNASDGYFFGYNGTSFGILHRNATVDTWVAQASWNQNDKANGTGASGFNLSPQFGNVYMIKYPYLGYGDIEFFVEDSNSARFILVHVIKYANTSAAIQLSNPNLQFYCQNLNAGNTANLIMYIGSVGIFSSGKRGFVASPKWAMDSYKASIGSTETCLLNLKNCTSFNGVTNRGLIRLNSLSASSTANTSAFIRLRLGATIGGSPSYATINGTTADTGVTITAGNSITSYDTAGTTAVGGTYLFNLSLGSASVFQVDLVPYELYIAPGEILTFSASAITNTNIGLSVNWSEDI